MYQGRPFKFTFTILSVIISFVILFIILAGDEIGYHNFDGYNFENKISLGIVFFTCFIVFTFHQLIYFKFLVINNFLRDIIEIAMPVLLICIFSIGYLFFKEPTRNIAQFTDFIFEKNYFNNIKFHSCLLTKADKKIHTYKGVEISQESYLSDLKVYFRYHPFTNNKELDYIFIDYFATSPTNHYSTDFIYEEGKNLKYKDTFIMPNRIHYDSRYEVEFNFDIKKGFGEIFHNVYIDKVYTDKLNWDKKELEHFVRLNREQTPYVFQKYHVTCSEIK